MNLTQMLTSLGEGIGAFLPKVMKALLDGFVAIFIDGTGETAKLSAVGTVAILFLVIGACYKFIPMIIGWLKLSAAKRKRKKARK